MCRFFILKPRSSYVITGDLRFVINDKVRKVLSKGPNFCKKISINFNTCLEELTISLDDCIIPNASFSHWKEAIHQVNSKIEKLKQFI